MPGLTRMWRAARGAAFLAVALFTLAGVRSQVMQASMSAPVAPICSSDMAGMAMGEAGSPASAPGKAHKVCDFCATAAHAPPQAEAARPPAPVTLAAIPPYAVRVGLGPRGPPPVTPKARGPPPTILTV